MLWAALLACTQTDHETSATGAELFTRYCASCHGVSGAGDGPVAATLVKPPADLTALARRAGGRFDSQAVMSTIDGRRQVEAHGPREMPVWGAIFEAEHPGQRHAFHLSLQKAKVLADYVATLQQQ